jgi:hypothetical protein
MDHIGLTPRRTIGPPAGPQQIVSLLSFDIHWSLQVSRESMTTPRYLPDTERRKVTPKKCVAQKPGSCLLLLNTTSPVLSGLTDNPTL